MNKHHLGPLIRQIRLAKGIGLNELARNAGLSGRSTHICNYEKCKKGALRTPDYLYPIAEALGTSVPALFLLQEICWVDPAILGNHEVLLAHLNRVHCEIERLAWRLPYSGGVVEERAA